MSKEEINMVGAMLIGILVGVLTFLILTSLTPKKKVIYTVNLTGLIDTYVASVAKIKTSNENGRMYVGKFAKKLEKNIKELARDRNIVIVPQEAVVAGAIDLTPVVLKKMYPDLPNPEQDARLINKKRDFTRGAFQDDK